MNDDSLDLRERCAAALDSYLEGGGENALHSAYELGREAMEQGMGVLDMTTVAHGALLLTLARRPGEGGRNAIRRAEPFLLECYSPFEMAHRGASEANRALRRNNERLEDEIRRLAYELHDQASQMLAAVHLSLDRLTADIAPEGRERLQLVRTQLREVESQMRRISHELRPTVLDDLGLIPALSFLGEGVANRGGLKVAVHGSVDGRLPPAVEMAFYRAAQEGLNNVARHARATLAALWVEQGDEGVVLRIVDDGIGFDAGSLARHGGSGGLGLAGIRARLAPLSGTLDVFSKPGVGTELRIAIPSRSYAHDPHPAGR